MVYLIRLRKISDIFVVLFIGFISLFAFDSSGVGFLIHLLPTLILGVLYFVLRKNLKYRVIIFLFLAIFSVFFFNADSNPIALIIVTGPLMIISALSYVIYNQKRR